MILRTKQRQIVFPRRPLVMGIVNLNDDSFSEDGTLDVNEAIHCARKLVSEGADIIDVGGESARTNRQEITEQQEVDRVASFIVRFRECYEGLPPFDDAQIFPPLLSVNTWRSPVANTLLSLGGDLLNDMSALSTDENACIAARHHTALLIMHSVGLPKEKHTDVQYADIMQTLERFFEDKLKLAEQVGLAREAVLIDPGIDFAKQRNDNLTILRELSRLSRARCWVFPIQEIAIPARSPASSPAFGLTLPFFGSTMFAPPVWSSGQPGKSWASRATDILKSLPKTQRFGKENEVRSID